MNEKLQFDKLKNLMKLLVIIAGMIFLFWLWLHRLEGDKGPKEPEGEAVSLEDVHILLEALDIQINLDETDSGEAEQSGSTTQEDLTYGQYKMIYEQIGGAEKGIPDYEGKYMDSYVFLKEDWYQAYRLMLAYLDTESSIWETTIFILKVDAQEKKLYTTNNEYLYCSSSFADSAFTKEEVYVKGDQILTNIRILPEETILENVWVMETTKQNGMEVLECFYHQVNFRVEGMEAAEREQVVDLTFQGGKLTDVAQKQDKIHGKLLSVSDSSMEIEGYGIYDTEENLEIYKLYGTLEAKKKTDLMIGYDYTDFVVYHDKICACLVSREGELDQIRVLLRNTAKGGYFYDEALVTVDGQQTVVQADEMESGERLVFQSNALTDRVNIEIEGINKGDNAYRGSVEFYKTAEGMAIINELPLEEYLYAVVPSEMPASYPEEALKAQAVCARTYAFQYILHAGLPDYGAHLDDTTSYQVYHNIAENAATTTAVKETAGMLLYHQGELARNYYYSTSCGYGTDTKIWKSDNMQEISYIQAGKLAPVEVKEQAPGAADMELEENFAAFIQTVDASDFESDEPWYRWRYEAAKIDVDAMLARLKERYQANAALVLTRQGKVGEYYYTSEPIKEIGKLKDINISKRGVGGIADEMILTGSKAVIKVISEYNIRRILCDGESKVVRQDGSSVAAGTLLPSAFFVIETGKEDGYVIGYTLIGGGYGHGVGMSQNGAKKMGSLGYSYQDILKFFFTDCEVRE